MFCFFYLIPVYGLKSNIAHGFILLQFILKE